MFQTVAFWSIYSGLQVVCGALCGHIDIWLHAPWPYVLYLASYCCCGCCCDNHNNTAIIRPVMCFWCSVHVMRSSTDFGSFGTGIYTIPPDSILRQPTHWSCTTSIEAVSESSSSLCAPELRLPRCRPRLPEVKLRRYQDDRCGP